MEQTALENRILYLLLNEESREQGFALMMQSYSESIYWHIRRIVVRHEDAEDALQETFLNAYKYLDSYSSDYSLHVWLYRIATNESLKLLKRRRKGLFESLDSLGAKLSQQVVAESSPDADRISVIFQQAVALLPTQQKLVFNLRYYNEMSYQQISEILGRSQATLKTGYHYAAEKVKRYIKQHGYE